jgi:hypothetical protein
MKKYLLNLSGHPLSIAAIKKVKGSKFIIEEVPFKEIEFRGNVEFQIKRIFKNVKSPIDGTDPIFIIPPGHNVLAILIVTYLHGLLGRFPTVCMLKENKQGVYLPYKLFEIDINNLRKKARNMRQKLWVGKLKTDKPIISPKI